MTTDLSTHTSANTNSADDRHDVGADAGAVTLPRLVHSEWVKLRSLRSAWYAYLTGAALTVGLGWMFCFVRAANWTHAAPSQRVPFDPTQVSMRGIYLAQLAVGVLGIVLVTGEYTTGMIRATVCASPRRGRIVVAKLLVIGAVTVVVMTGAAFVAFVIGQIALGPTGLHASLSTPGAARAVIGAGLYLAVLAGFATGLGFLLRNTAGAVVALFGTLLVLPLLAQTLPGHWATDVIKVLPMPAGMAIMSTTPDPTSMAPWPGLGLFAGYAAAVLVAGTVVLRSRDA